MPLHEYVIRSVWERERDRCQRAAVLFPLCPRLAESKNPNRLVQGMYSLLRQWRARLNRLQAKGWSRVTDENFAYLASCPPFAANTEYCSLRCCHYPRVCPMCWARDIALETFIRLEWAFYNEADGLLQRQEQGKFYDLVELRLKQLKPCFPQGVPVTTYFSEAGDRKRYFRHVAGVGGFWLTTIEPRGKQWQIHHRALAIVPAGRALYEEAQWRSPEWKVTRHRDITRRALSLVVARVCRYPIGMMRGNSRRTIELLTCAPKTRLLGYYGALRNGAIRQRPGDF